MPDFNPTDWRRATLGVIRPASIRAVRPTRTAAQTKELLDLIAFHGYLKPIIDQSYTYGTRQTNVERDGITYAVVEANRRRIRDVTEHAFLNDASATVYPGALIQGRALYIGDSAPIIVDRAPGTLTIATEFIQTSPGSPQPTPKSKSAHVENPTLAHITDARVKLLHDLNPSDGTGLLKTTYESAHSWGETSTVAGISAHGITWGVDAGVNYNTSYDKSTVVFVLKQIFYTCVFTPDMSGIDGFLASTVTPDYLLPYVPDSYVPGEQNPPLWVDSVSYGRMLIIEVTASTTADDLKVAVKAHYDWVGGGAKANLDVGVKNTMKTATARVISVGAGAAGRPKDVTNPLDDLKQVYNDAANLSVANPGGLVSFTARHIMNNTLAHVGLVGSWTQPVSVQGPDADVSLLIWDGPQGGPRQTGIDVVPGDDVTISATGEISPGLLFFGGAPPDGWTGWRAPDGSPVPEGNAFSLVARYGQEQWFQVGSNHRGTNEYNRTLPLQLGINDSNQTNGTPTNQWAVDVSVRRRGAAAARIFI